MSQIAIQTRGLGKRYHIGAAEQYATLRDRLAGGPRWIARKISNMVRGQRPSARPSIWAVRDVNLDIAEGEVVGIIGRNGAGKSTLLKILSRITSPTVGEARIAGRIGSLLEVGTGFHPELTGRENVFVNGTVLGMSRREVARKFDEIIAFAGVEKFIDTPVKHYSSGMRMRLAFAVAAHLETDILVVDEVLAVGDAAFQRRCFDRMSDVARLGRTILVVSHQMESIETLCARAVWLEQGGIVADGEAGTVVRSYLAQTIGNVREGEIAERVDRRGDGRLRFTAFEIIDHHGNPSPYILAGDPVTLRFHYVASSPLRDVEVAIWFKDGLGRRLMCLYTKMTGATFREIPALGAFDCHIPRFPLAPAIYAVDVNSTAGTVTTDKLELAAQIQVIGADFFGVGHKTTGYGDFLCDHEWSLPAFAVRPVEAAR